MIISARLWTSLRKRTVEDIPISAARVTEYEIEGSTAGTATGSMNLKCRMHFRVQEYP